MQIPLEALPAAAMKPSATSVVSTLVGSAAFAAADVVGGCKPLAYADGGIYCRTGEDGVCGPDLGDFPAKRSFPLYLLWTDDHELHLLERDTPNRRYTRFKDQLYIDVSPGAFEPLRFTADNSTLEGGETSWAWTGALGSPLWSPTGLLGDAFPTEQIQGQGFDWVDVEGYPGLQRAYWNQTLYEEMYAGRAEGNWLVVCYGDYDPTIIKGDRP